MFFFFASQACARDVSVEGRVAYFCPTGAKFREIYGGGALCSLEVSAETYCDIYSWFSVGYLRSTGHCIGGDYGTTLDMVPFSLGLKYHFCACRFRPYLGVGLGLNYIHTRDDSPYVIRDRSNWGFGGVFKGGFLYKLRNRYFIDGFIDYTAMKAGFKNHCHKVVECYDADVSGFSIGLGLGRSF